MTGRTCTLCGAPAGLERWAAEHVCYVTEHMVLTVPTPGFGHARCTDPACARLELVDLEVPA